MLVLGETLQKVGMPAYTRFSRVGYSQSGSISALLTEKSNAEELTKGHSNTLIRATKSVDEGVMFHWEIESSTGIKLKTRPRRLVKKAQLEEGLESGTGKGSAIVITVGNSTEAVRLEIMK